MCNVPFIFLLNIGFFRYFVIQVPRLVYCRYNHLFFPAYLQRAPEMVFEHRSPFLTKKVATDPPPKKIIEKLGALGMGFARLAPFLTKKVARAPPPKKRN